MNTNDPLNKEIGGTHYQKYKMQPIELIVACKWDFIQGTIAGYLLRAKYKNGQQDIDKAIHCCELGARLQYVLGDEHVDNDAIIKAFIRINSLNYKFWFRIFELINEKYYSVLYDELVKKEAVGKYLL